MLSGEILNGPSLSVALFSHVPLELIELYGIMATLASIASQQQQQQQSSQQLPPQQTHNQNVDEEDGNILLGKKRSRNEPAAVLPYTHTNRTTLASLCCSCFFLELVVCCQVVDCSLCVSAVTVKMLRNAIL